MTVRNRIFRFSSCLLVICLAGVSAARADCSDLLKQFAAAFAGRSYSDVDDLSAKIAGDGSCSEGDIRKTRMSRAELQFDRVKALVQKGAPQAEYEPLLVSASELLWEAAAQMGNLKSEKRDFAAATMAYERAIELVKNSSITPVAPNKETIEAIVGSATETRMLAANEEGRAGQAVYVPAAKDHRDGSVGGAMSVSIRDIRINSIPIPIGFETASTKFTVIGEKAANDFLLALQQQRPSKVTLVGHTDERGEADYNIRLSDARVKAVAAFLKQNGITAKITTVAKGKSEPLKVTDPSFTREDVWALNRRVEWKRQ